VWRRDLRRYRSALTVVDPSRSLSRWCNDLTFEYVAHAALIRNHGRHCAAVSCERVIRLKAASVSAANFLMYGAGGGGEYMWRRDLRRSRSALSVSTQGRGGLSPGYAHRVGVPFRGLQLGGVISGG